MPSRQRAYQGQSHDQACSGASVDDDFRDGRLRPNHLPATFVAPFSPSFAQIDRATDDGLRENFGSLPPDV